MGIVADRREELLRLFSEIGTEGDKIESLPRTMPPVPANATLRAGSAEDKESASQQLRGRAGDRRPDRASPAEPPIQLGAPARRSTATAA